MKKKQAADRDIIAERSIYLITVRDMLRHAMSEFARAGIAHGHGTTSAIDEAAFIILESLRLPVEDINPWLDARLLPEERKAILKLIEARIETRRPAAYLLGHTYIQGVRLRADERALVPRSYIGELLFSEHFGGDAPLLADPDTIESVLDLCTGSGSLAILAAMAFPRARVDATDISGDALALARLNVADQGLKARVHLKKGDLFGPVGRASYDLIISNPPYVDEEGMAELPEEYRHEPALALDGGEQGIAIVRRILAEAVLHLNPGGGLLCEVGRCRDALEAAYPDVDFLWIDTEESSGEVFWVTKEQLGG
ncbi:MAG: 50S ribosomal protein L3 N(5)-glutamine methyltransferase [Rhizobiales bacterium]|nr:50S ribosomal protein L3 N(5)-glutamine methyltransferase [Hyphomicrobiales bacterium]